MAFVFSYRGHPYSPCGKNRERYNRMQTMREGDGPVRILRYLGGHKIALLLAFVLLLGCAATDLALPYFTSNIVDVGIQQAGIEHVAVDEMSDSTHAQVQHILDGSDEADLFAESYEQAEGDTYRLTAYGEAHREELDRALAAPLIAVHDPHLLDEVREQADANADEDSLLAQAGIAAAQSEYVALGRDTTAMQMEYLRNVGLAMLLIAAANMGLNILVGLVAARTGATIGRDLRHRLFSRVVAFSSNEIDKFSAASLITRGTNDITLIQNVSIMLVRMVFYAPVLAVGGIVMVMVTNARMGWVVVVAIVAVLCMVAILFKVAMPKFKIMQKLIDRVNLVAREMLTGMPVIRAFDRQAYEEGRFDVASTDLMRTQLFTNRVMTFMMPTMMLIMNLTSVAIVWVGAGYIDAGFIQTGDLIAFITYSMVIIMSFLILGMMSIMLPRADVAAGRVNEVLATEPSINDPATADRNELPASARAHGARIVFDDVTFAYDEGSKPALEHISFTAEPGTTLALIGGTGSGKSTVLKLLMRFYDVNEGVITLDGVDIRSLDQSDLRENFGYVPQKAFLFAGTVRSNVAYSDETMDEARVTTAIQTAQAAGFVGEFPEGDEHEIAQGGTNVSGGQRQRLAMARALATQARAYLFDDSFSALDYRTDADLRSALEVYAKDSTRVIVAQRVSTIMDADRIVVLDEGRIAGMGTHDELMATCDEYRDIALTQLSAEELGLGGGEAA